MPWRQFRGKRRGNVEAANFANSLLAFNTVEAPERIAGANCLRVSRSVASPCGICAAS
jgi:hypothetical protein